MKTQRGFATILAIIIGLVIVGVGIYLVNTFNNEQENKVDNDFLSTEELDNFNNNEETDTVELNKSDIDNDEDTESEIFNNTLGKVLSIKEVELNKWVLEVDLLTRNPEFGPSNLDVPSYFNKSSRIRQLYINENTKIYNCDFSNGTYTYTFKQNPKVDLMNNQIKRYQNEGAGELIEIFDILDSDITAIHMVCAS